MEIETNIRWQAQWIWGSGEESPRNEWWCFRKTFTAPDQLQDAVSLAITADSRYVLYVNGESVGRGPVRSWPFSQAYDTYDISRHIRPGQANTIAVLVIHYGVSTFYYLRGRGGLLAQIDFELNGDITETVGTDSTWQCSRYSGQEPRTPRMFPAQAFAEHVDARAWQGDWTAGAYDDSFWTAATVLGPVGTEPWVKLQPRDIPYLTEEPIYPVRVECLNKVKPVSWTTAIDVRNHMVAGSEDHGNRSLYAGYLATVVQVPHKTTATLGFPNATAIFGPCKVNGKWYRQEDFTGEHPERYAEVELEAGDNLLLIDVTGGDHGHGLHVGLDCAIPFTLRSPLDDPGSESSVFIGVGPFDASSIIDHQPRPKLNREHPAYLAAAGVSSVGDLRAFAEWIKPVPEKLVSAVDLFALSVWKRESVSQSIPAALHNAVIPHDIPAVVPLYEDADTEFVIDFGKEYSGYLTFELDAAAGTVVDLYGFEYMRDGWRQDTFDLDNTLRYICRDGRQTYTSPIRRGLRYLMVTIRSAARPVKLYRVKMVQSNYPVAEIGQFSCSDALLNDIWEISRHTAKMCMEDTFVDCPAYEQTFWVGDSRNEALVNYYVFGAHEIVKRCLKIVPGSSFQTPLYVDQVPSGWNSVIPNWTFFWAISCKEYYEHTGDRQFAADIWPHVRFTLEHYLQRIDERGLFASESWNLLDWAPMDQPDEGVVTHSNFFLQKTLREVSELAQAAGDREGADKLRAEADRLQLAIRRHLWCDAKQAYIDCIHVDGRRSSIYSMQTQVVAYLCGEAEGERRVQLERLMLAPPADFVQIGSPFMSFFLYEALAGAGQYEQMLDDIRLNYGQMIEHGATTCWEMYPNFAENRANPKLLTRSHCHAWSAAPGYFLGAHVLGVSRTSIGWKSVAVKPQPCGLSWARGSVPLPDGGRVDVSWKAAEAERTMQLEVWAPRGLELSVELADGYTGTIMRHEI